MHSITVLFHDAQAKVRPVSIETAFVPRNSEVIEFEGHLFAVTEVRYGVRRDQRLGVEVTAWQRTT